MKTIQGENWYTQTEFARLYGTSVQSVHNAVLRGTIKSRKVKGRIFVSGEPLPTWKERVEKHEDVPAVDEPMDAEPVEAAPVQAPAHPVPFDYQTAKTAKMVADSEIARIKAERMNDELTAHYCQVLTDKFIACFTPLKVRLTELDLKASQIKALRVIVDDCLDAFRTEVAKLNEET